jgi:hypothetical protein
MSAAVQLKQCIVRNIYIKYLITEHNFIQIAITFVSPVNIPLTHYIINTPFNAFFASPLFVVSNGEKMPYLGWLGNYPPI